MAEPEFEPLILAFCCNWSSAYAVADMAGTARISYPSNIRIMRVKCSGMIHPSLVMDALQGGVDGVLTAGCQPCDCRYGDGNLKTERRFETLHTRKEGMGIETQRLRLERISSGEGEKFAETVREMTEQLKKDRSKPVQNEVKKHA